jgi:hypothetical protein
MDGLGIQRGAKTDSSENEYRNHDNNNNNKQSDEYITTYTIFIKSSQLGHI